MKFILSFFCLVFSPTLFAYEPCMPFCDARCASPKIAKWGGQFASDTSEVTAAYTQLNGSLSNVNNSMAQFAVDFSEELTNNHLDLTRALDASNNKLELTTLSSGKVVQSYTDSFASAWNDATKNTLLVKSLVKTDLSTSKKSQPNTAFYEQMTNVDAKKDLIREIQGSAYISMTEGRNVVDQTQRSQTAFLTAYRLSDVQLVNVLNTIYDNESITTLNRLIASLMTANKSDLSTASNAKLNIVAAVLSNLFSQSILHEDVPASYTNYNRHLSTLYSIQGSLVGENATLTKSGLLRKIAIQKQLNSALLFDLYMLRKNRLLLIALLADAT